MDYSTIKNHSKQMCSSKQIYIRSVRLLTYIICEKNGFINKEL